jgi:hypothetical protein
LKSFDWEFGPNLSCPRDLANFISIHRFPRSAPSSLELLQTSKVRTAVIVAHPVRILRCAWVARKLGFAVRLLDYQSGRSAL